MTKSPVYGLGRNKNHRPKGSANHPSAANVNMKGRKTKVMGCYCCYCVDFRDDMIKRLHMQEIQQYSVE